MPTGKMSATLDARLLQQVRRRVGRRGLLGFVNQAVAEKLQRERLLELLDAGWSRSIESQPRRSTARPKQSSARSFVAPSRGARRASRGRWHPAARGTVVIDSGAVRRVAEGSGKARVIVEELVERSWHLTLPAAVLVECLTGEAGRDAPANRFLNAVQDRRATEEPQARAAAALRFHAGNPSVVDALVAELALRLTRPVVVLTTDPDDIAALVGGAPRVSILGVLAHSESSQMRQVSSAGSRLSRPPSSAGHFVRFWDKTGRSDV